MRLRVFGSHVLLGVALAVRVVFFPQRKNEKKGDAKPERAWRVAITRPSCHSGSGSSVPWLR